MDREFSDTKGPMVKAILLAVALAAIFVLKDVIPNIGKTLFSNFDDGKDEQKNAYYFNEEDQKSILKEVAGYWMMTEQRSKHHRVDNRVELASNSGVYWYEKHDITLPNDSTFTYFVQRGDVLEPYYQKEGDSAYDCNITYVQRSFLFDDTCRADMEILPERYGLLSIYKPSDSTLIINDSTYTLYTGKPQDFFPINIVNSIDNREFYVCTAKENELEQRRIAIAKSIGKIPYSAELQEKLVTEYYIPLLLKSLGLNFNFGKGEPLIIDITIKIDGTVKNVSLKGKATTSPALKNAIKNEIKQWKFLCTGTENKVSVTEVME